MFNKQVWLFLLQIYFYFCTVKCNEINIIEKSFKKGVKAYSEEKWSKCVEHFEEALHQYKLYKSVLINCRTKCNSQSKVLQVKENFEDLKIYEQFFNKRDCLSKCQDMRFHEIAMKNDLGDHALYNMQTRRPYEYLHMCYYQLHMFYKAASSAYTFLIANPTDSTMKSNYKYYKAMPEVDPDEIIDLEGDDYLVLFSLGKKAYKLENWADAVASMEEVLKDFIASENDCRVECEHQPGQESTSEFVMTVSNNVAALLHCQQQCQDKLKILEFESGLKFLAEVLHYLQMSYYHLNQYKKAAEAVESYLMILPRDETMLTNKKFYAGHVEKKDFVRRPDIEHYFKRDYYEKSLLDFFHQGKNDSSDSNSI